MLTFTGIHITQEFGAPSIRDIAVQSMRIARFAGAGRIFYPVGIHMMLVADLLPPELEPHGLLHDGGEICVGEVPRPMKTDAARGVEHAVLARTYASLGLALPTEEEQAIIKAADMDACNVEGVSECGPRGFIDTQSQFSVNTRAQVKLTEYLENLTANIARDLFDPDGYWPITFERRLRRCLRALRHAGISIEEKAVA